MNIDDIRHRVLSGHYLISFMHTEKLRRRKISLATIEDAIRTGTIIENYPKDPEALMPHSWPHTGRTAYSCGVRANRQRGDFHHYSLRAKSRRMGTRLANEKKGGAR